MECIEGVLTIKGVILPSGKQLYTVSDDAFASAQLPRYGTVVWKTGITVASPIITVGVLISLKGI
jgi:hypothetical protein